MALNWPKVAFLAAEHCRCLLASIPSFPSAKDSMLSWPGGWLHIRTIFSERELTFTFAICYHPSGCLASVVCLSVVCNARATVQAVQIFRNISTALGTLAIRWHSLKISRRCPRGTPPPGELNTRGIAKYSDFGPIDGYISETVKIAGGKLVLITNRKSYMNFRLVPKSVTTNDLERRNGVILRYFSEFG